MSKHTPGPWTFLYKGRQEWLIDAPNGDPEIGYTSWEGLASVYGCVDDKTTGNIVGDANARLIAAAPELLEALNRVLLWADPFALPNCDRNSADVEFARSAIAKAEGKV